MAVLDALKRTIRKYTGGGLANPDDAGIPLAQVQVYLRSAEGETFYVPTLYEGIQHLLSNQGYRLGVYESPDGNAWSERYAIVLFRAGDSLGVRLEAPMLRDVRELNEISFDLSYTGPKSVEPPEVVHVLATKPIDPDNPPVPMTAADLYKEMEVTIDGQ